MVAVGRHVHEWAVIKLFYFHEIDGCDLRSAIQAEDTTLSEADRRKSESCQSYGCERFEMHREVPFLS